MSTAVASPPNVLDYIRSLSDEDKKIALVELTEEYIRIRGLEHSVRLTKSDGEPVAYLIPDGVAHHYLRYTIPKQTPEQIAEIQAAIDDIDNTFDPKEYFEELSRRDQD